MTLARALRAEALRLRRSPLVALHLVCPVAAAAACGAYFAAAPWDARFGVDAYVQLVGAMMPLMAGIVCGLDIDASREATGLTDLLAPPSRRCALAARVLALWVMGAAALAVAVGGFGAVLAAVGSGPFPVAVYAQAAAGMAGGSLVLYAAFLPLALAFGRNAAIAVGAVGLMCTFLSVGGLAHGLMTGELTALSSGALGMVPLTWSARLGSLAVEGAIASGAAARHVIDALVGTVLAAAVVTAAVLALLLVWIGCFEDCHRGE